MTGAEVVALGFAVAAVLRQIREGIKDLSYRNELDAERGRLRLAWERLALDARARQLEGGPPYRLTGETELPPAADSAIPCPVSARRTDR
jgi:hypothetical protein